MNHNNISSAQPVDLLTYDPHPHRTVIHCQLRSIQQPRARIQWELLACMMPDGVKWSSQTAAGAKWRDARRHTGFLDYNQQSHDKDIWPQTALSALFYPLNAESEYVEKVRPDVLSEMYEPREVGRMIMNVVATDALPVQWRKTPNWPLFLARGVPAPVIEYTCQAKCMNSSWGNNILPLLFAAQERGVHTHNPIEQLALAFQPMITLFTLYYLDTRESRQEPMPDWMVLFGAVYDEYGMELLAFYPSFRVPKYEALDSAGNWEWGAGAFSISSDHTEMMRRPVWERGSAFAKLYRIQGHCKNVLEHLQSWDGFGTISERLSRGVTLD